MEQRSAPRFMTVTVADIIRVSKRLYTGGPNGEMPAIRVGNFRSRRLVAQMIQAGMSDHSVAGSRRGG